MLENTHLQRTWLCFCNSCEPNISIWEFKKMLKIVSSLSVSPLALGLYTVNAVYGDTITMPCRLEVPDGLMFGKWKYVSIAYLYIH